MCFSLSFRGEIIGTRSTKLLSAKSTRWAAPGLRYHTFTQPCSGVPACHAWRSPRASKRVRTCTGRNVCELSLWVCAGLTTPGAQTWYTFHGLTLLPPLQTEVCSNWDSFRKLISLRQLEPRGFATSNQIGGEVIFWEYKRWYRHSRFGTEKVKHPSLEWLSKTVNEGWGYINSLSEKFLSILWGVSLSELAKVLQVSATRQEQDVDILSAIYHRWFTEKLIDNRTNSRMR